MAPMVRSILIPLPTPSVYCILSVVTVYFANRMFGLAFTGWKQTARLIRAWLQLMNTFLHLFLNSCTRTLCYLFNPSRRGEMWTPPGVSHFLKFCTFVLVQISHDTLRHWFPARSDLISHKFLTFTDNMFFAACNFTKEACKFIVVACVRVISASGLALVLLYV